MIKLTRLVLVSALVPAFVGIASTPAQALCTTPGRQYSTTQASRYIGNTSTRVYGAPGTTLSIARGTTKTVTGSLQTTLSAEAGVIFAKASASVGITIGLSKSVTTTTGGTWTVPATRNPGWFEMGAHGYQISWTAFHYNSPCTYVKEKSGTLLGPTGNLYFMHN